jgi:hypothetical protein
MLLCLQVIADGQMDCKGLLSPGANHDVPLQHRTPARHQLAPLTRMALTPSQSLQMNATGPTLSVEVGTTQTPPSPRCCAAVAPEAEQRSGVVTGQCERATPAEWAELDRVLAALNDLPLALGSGNCSPVHSPRRDFATPALRSRSPQLRSASTIGSHQCVDRAHATVAASHGCESLQGGHLGPCTLTLRHGHTRTARGMLASDMCSAACSGVRSWSPVGPEPRHGSAAADIDMCGDRPSSLGAGHSACRTPACERQSLRLPQTANTLSPVARQVYASMRLRNRKVAQALDDLSADVQASIRRVQAPGVRPVTRWRARCGRTCRSPH